MRLVRSPGEVGQVDGVFVPGRGIVRIQFERQLRPWRQVEVVVVEVGRGFDRVLCRWPAEVELLHQQRSHDDDQPANDRDVGETTQAVECATSSACGHEITLRCSPVATAAGASWFLRVMSRRTSNVRGYSIAQLGPA